MKISDIKKMENHELVSNIVFDYAHLCLRANYGGGTKQMQKQFDALCSEATKRNLLTEEEHSKFNR